MVVYDSDQENSNRKCQEILNRDRKNKYSLLVTSGRTQVDWSDIDYQVAISNYDDSALSAYMEKILIDGEMVDQFRQSMDGANLIKSIKYPFHIFTLIMVWWYNNCKFPKSSANLHSQILYVVFKHRLSKFLPALTPTNGPIL